MLNKNILCCYCGIEAAFTKDHIPPKGIFNKPRAHDLITVPCCFKCNNEASTYDERFKTFLGMHVARNGGEGERLFKEGVLPTAKHNSRLRSEIFKSMYPVDIVNEEGIIIDKAMAVPWDNEAHDFTIERITRGLFFHHYKKILSINIEISINWLSKPFKTSDDNLYINSIANGNFIYRYNKLEEADDSAWFFSFYNSHFASCIVTTPHSPTPPSQSPSPSPAIQ